jgi:hypothetical protein
MSILDIKAAVVESSHDQVKGLAPPQKKSVHFENEAHYCEIDHINDFSPELIAATWLQDDEYAGIAAENTKVALLMMLSGKRIKNIEDVTERGLEYKLPDQRDKSLRLKELALNAVIDEQDRQWRSQIHDDPAFIAEVYQDFSTQALSVARSMGIQDEEDAKQIATVEDSSVAKKFRRSVAFAQSDDVRLSQHLTDFTDEEIRNTWYDCEDFRQFKVSNKKTARALLKCDINESDEVSLRGLEYLVLRNAKVRKHIKALALNAVLDAQDRQENEAWGFDDELIAREYGEIANTCVAAALQLARADERFASVYTEADKICWLQLAPPSPHPAAYASNDICRASLSNQLKKSQTSPTSCGSKQKRKKVFDNICSPIMRSLSSRFTTQYLLSSSPA